MAQGINLLIADDHPLFLEGIKMLLSKEADLNITGIANDGKELLQLLNQLPDINLILLDVNMPNLNGLDTIKHIKDSFKAVRILMLSAYSDAKLIEEAKLAGADGYILKNSNRETLTGAIRSISQGEKIFEAPQVEIAVDNFINSQVDISLRKYNLTKREKEILIYIRQTYTNQQIADKLHLSIYTVETHRKNIMQKLQLSSPAALVKFLIESGI